MKTHWSVIAVWTFNAAAAVIGLLVLSPLHISVCANTAGDPHQYCPEYELLEVALGLGSDTLFSSAFWTAAATVAIAIFTWTLKRATDRLWTSARDASGHQLRAYIHVEKVDVDGKVGGTNPPAFKVRFKNYGQTPARRVSHKCNMCLTFGDNEPRLRDYKHHRYADLGPSQGRTTILFTDDTIWEFEQMSAGIEAALYLVGEITYFDAFQSLEKDQIPRSTQYRYLVHVTKSGSVLLSGAEGGNDST